MDGDASFGYWLRLRRKALRLSCVELARRVGCATVTLRKIEADERRPSQQIAAKLAEELTVALQEHLTFIKVARGELGVHRLAPADQIADRPAHAAGTPLRTKVPIPPTPLIGRAHEVAAMQNYLTRADVRLLTLIGAPGIGKTRLAMEVALELHETFADGVYFIPLAPIRDPELVLATIAQALEISELPGQRLLERLQTYLLDRHLLLVLDNMEQVLKAAPQLAALLSAAPRLTLLVTSRVALHLSGEQRFAMQPLALPPNTLLDDGGGPGREWQALKQYPAMELFIQRSQAAMPTFILTATNAPAIATICRRLDGLPLAIELAAARVVLFTPQELLTGLDQRLALLTTGAVDLPTHQQTLRRAIDWSYDLLDTGEQTLFRWLGVFVGSCSLEAINLVCDTADDLGLDVLEGVTALLDKSLLQREEGTDGRSRFTMLETIREYALEQLAASGETDVLRRRHAECFLALAETAEPQFHGPDQRAWLDRVEVEHDNLRAALVWSLEARRTDPQSPRDHLQSTIGLRLAAALWWFWDRRGYLPEGRRWLERTLAADRGSTTLERVKALVRASTLAGWMYDFELARALGEESLALAHQQENSHGIAWSLFALGLTATFQNDPTTARPLFEESLVLLRALGDILGQVLVLSSLGNIVRRQGDYTEATTYHTASLTLARNIGDTWCAASALGQLGSLAQAQGDYAHAAALLAESLALHQELGEKGQGISWVRFSLGAITWQQGDHTRALAHFAESLAWFRELEDTIGMAACLEGIAQVAIATMQPVRAVQLFGAAAAIRDTLGNPPYPDEQREYDHLLTTAREQLREDAFEAAWAVGRTMSLKQAVNYALEGEAKTTSS